MGTLARWKRGDKGGWHSSCDVSHSGQKVHSVLDLKQKHPIRHDGYWLVRALKFKGTCFVGGAWPAWTIGRGRGDCTCCSCPQFRRLCWDFRGRGVGGGTARAGRHPEQTDNRGVLWAFRPAHTTPRLRHVHHTSCYRTHSINSQSSRVVRSACVFSVSDSLPPLDLGSPELRFHVSWLQRKSKPLPRTGLSGHCHTKYVLHAGRHPFSEQVFIEHPHCTRVCTQPQRCSSKQDKVYLPGNGQEK